MVELPHGFKAYQYQSGIDRICDAYRASISAMASLRRDAEEAAAAYEATGEDDSEYDEDNVLTSSSRHSLTHAEMEAGLAFIVVREAFITSAFHYWERSARGWTGLHAKRDGYLILREASIRKYPVSSHLDILNRLNNLLKHSGDPQARELADLRPDYFSPSFPGLGSDQHRLKLYIADEHVQEALVTVRNSGPAFET